MRLPVVGLLSLLLVANACGDGEPAAVSTSLAPRVATTTLGAPATTSTTASPVPTITTGSASIALGWPVVVANHDGVFNISTDGAIEPIVDGPVAYAVDDTQGGLLFQVDRGPNWEQRDNWSTVVWWVPSGSSAAQELLVPAPGGGQTLALHDAYPSAGGFGVLYVRSEAHDPEKSPHEWVDTLRRYERSSETVKDLLQLPAYEHGYEFSVGAGTIAITESDVAGSSCWLLDLEGDRVPLGDLPAWFDGPDDELLECSLSENRLTMLGFRLVDAEPSALIRSFDRVTNAVVNDLAVPIDGRWSPDSVDVGDGRLLLNRQWEGMYEPALLFDLASHGFVELPVAGRGRFVAVAVDIPSPVQSPAVH